MFKSNQIMSSTQLIRYYSEISKMLFRSPQALLITHRGGNMLVLVNNEIFEDLLEFKVMSDKAIEGELMEKEKEIT